MVTTGFGFMSIKKVLDFHLEIFEFLKYVCWFITLARISNRARKMIFINLSFLLCKLILKN